MTNLSYQTQAIIDAFTKDNCLHDWKHNHYNLNSLAAALIAVNEYIVLPKYQYADWEMAHLIGQEIRAIAEELEETCQGMFD